MVRHYSRLRWGDDGSALVLLRFLDVLGNHVMGFDGELGGYTTYLDYLDSRRSEDYDCMGSIYWHMHKAVIESWLAIDGDKAVPA